MKSSLSTRRHALGALALSVLAAMLLASSADAAEPKALWQKCGTGTGAGQCLSPFGVATDEATGHSYVVDNLNFRINEFGPWGEFLKAWGWGVADGGDEPQVCGPAASPPTSACQRGLPGSGSGQLGGGPGTTGSAKGVAVDSSGSIYVYESRSCTGGASCDVAEMNNRVQKFSPDGDFVLMFGGGVNLTKVQEREEQEDNGDPVTITPAEENLCTATSGDECGAGRQGGGPGEFGFGDAVQFPIDPTGAFIAVDSTDEIHVGGYERIQRFSANGEYQGAVSLPGEMVRALSVTPLGEYIVAYAAPNQLTVGNQSKPNVVTLSSTGSLKCAATVADPRAVAAGPSSGFYVVDAAGGDLTIHSFNANCNASEPPFLADPSGVSIGLAATEACDTAGTRLLYSSASNSGSYVRAYRPAPDPEVCPPPLAPPAIEAQYARSVGASSAVVGAEINPQFWPDTTYYLEYGTEECASSPTACEQTRLLPGAPLDAEDDVAEPTAGVSLSGLEPDTTYHFRFVAESSGGGPVHGVDPDGEGAGGANPEEGLSGAFTTYPLPSTAPLACPNDAFRTGPSASLPDCRAYEIASPIDKGGGDIVPMGNPSNSNEPASLDQSAASGERLTFSSYRSFGETPSAPYTSQYMARRGAGGWVTEPISLPQEGGRLLENEILSAGFKLFSEDLCDGWVQHAFEPALTEDALTGYTNLYRRDNCGTGGLQGLTTIEPSFEASAGVFEALEPNQFVPAIMGASADGLHQIFVAPGGLTEDAAPCKPGNCPRQLYDFHEGAASLVCVLPSGSPSPDQCWPGAAKAEENLRNSVHHAISEDGSRIFWTSEKLDVPAAETKKLYVRIDGVETRQISNQPTFFWGAAADGSRALYSVTDGSSAAGDLWEYELESGDRQRIAKDTLGVMGMSEDADRVYFASEEVLTGGEENSEGQSAIAGEANLYLYEKNGEEEATIFVATLAESDVEMPNAPSPIKSDPFFRSARVSGDGLHAAFTSTAPLTGVDNTVTGVGEGATQVFLYDADAAELRCVSCSPGGARPQLAREATVNSDPTGLWRAGSIPGWTHQSYPSRLISEDGDRLFFESTEPLLLSDTNGKRDVYEWQTGASQVDCEKAGADLFLDAEGGCLSLISTGQSSSDSSFVDASIDGRDVFFKTGESLLPQDPGLIDIYDAREGGGFPPPPAPRAPCEGQACQSPPAAPEVPTPASSAFQGPADPRSTNAPRPRRCPKGKRRARRAGRVRCVPRATEKRAKRSRRDGRDRH